MANSTTIQARIDSDTKEKAKVILDTLGLSMSEAICIYLRQIVLLREIPFKIKIPNDVTLSAVEKLEAGKDVHEVSNVEELFEELDA